MLSHRNVHNLQPFEKHDLFGRKYNGAFLPTVFVLNFTTNEIFL